MRAVDLFAGAGGFSEGARQAGIQVVWAANHEPLAVATHSRNHPETAHSCQDLQLADWTKLPGHEVLMASPCCQGHSKAKGSTKDWSEKSRSTAWCVYSCAVANRPKAIIVENVPEFRTWSEDDESGYVFRTWRDVVSRIGVGYHYSDVVIDAADLGVPQHRERLFMAFIRKDIAGPLQFATLRQAHVAASSILEAGSKLKWSRVQDKAATTQGFVQRTEARRFDKGTPFLVPYFSKTLKTGLGRDLNRPVGTITTKARYAVVSDCHKWLRMFTIDEYRRAMAFPANYELPPSQEAAVRQLGNAVCPPVAAWVLNQVQAHLGARRIAA